MKYPQRVQDILDQMVAQNQTLAHSANDDDRRKLNHMVAEQVAFEFGPAWGTKSADPGRPESKDSIAFQDGGKLWGFDTINGGTREANQFPDAEDITGQHFIPVTPVNHLSATPSPAPSPTPAPQAASTCSCDMSKLQASFDTLAAKLEQLAAEHDAQTNLLNELIKRQPAAAPAFPTRAEGSLFGYKVVLTLKP